MLRYKCLVLDHDDTSVDSCRACNYPQFEAYVPTIRPGVHFTREEYLLRCSEYGFYNMCRTLLHYTETELEDHIRHWKSYVSEHIAPFFPGIPEIITRVKAEGGFVCVVSHSFENTIRPVYDHFGIVQPDIVLGAEQPAERQKPNAWPLEHIMEQLHLSPSDLLMVDDAPLGGEMARRCGVKFAGAAWYGMPEVLEQRLRENCDIFLPTVEDLARELFPEE